MKVSAIALDFTRYFTIDEEDKPFIKAIKAVFFYEPDVATYCCELTPSYFLEYLYTYVEYKDADDRPESTDKESEAIRARCDERYCYEQTDDFYMHCSAVKALTPQRECGEFENADEAREHLQGNWPI